MTSLAIPSHQKSFTSAARVFLSPKCPLIGALWSLLRTSYLKSLLLGSTNWASLVAILCSNCVFPHFFHSKLGIVEFAHSRYLAKSGAKLLLEARDSNHPGSSTIGFNEASSFAVSRISDIKILEFINFISDFPTVTDVAEKDKPLSMRCTFKQAKGLVYIKG